MDFNGFNRFLFSANYQLRKYRLNFFNFLTPKLLIS